ncbi:hypothetical protein C8R28_10793 [Nitrosomonas ureae]|uniref:Uncharacterized protein n=1 Tax=Nitrosomonas ureae TaxID=44577 RepID=A0A2T5HZS7_9PROT|nr:hypothetical protein C8R28_10793 [Nitrosomonas ureae]
MIEYCSLVDLISSKECFIRTVILTVFNANAYAVNTKFFYFDNS